MFRKIITGLRVERGLKLVWQSSRKWLTISVSLTILISALPVFALYMQKILFDFLADGLINRESASIEVLAWIIIIICLIEVIGILFRCIGNYSTTVLGATVQDFVMTKLHHKSVELDLSYYETPSYYDSLHLAQVEAPKRTALFVQTITSIAQNGLSLIAVLGLLVTYHWGIAGLMLIAVVPGLLINLKSSDKLFKWRTKAAAREREVTYYHDLITTSAAAKEVRVFGFGSTLGSWFQELRSKLRTELFRIIYWEQSRTFIVNASSIIALYLGFFFFALETFRGNFTMGDIALFYSAFHRAQGLLRGTVSGISSLYECNLFLNNLFKILAITPKIIQAPKSIVMPKQQTPIVFKNVSFSYPDSKRQALKDVSITINPGEHIAIVGKNGSGKSTFVKLLCRLYDRTGGQIEMNGVNITDYDILEYRKSYSVLFQDYLQFSLSVRDNIWLGNVDSEKQSEAIEKSALLSGANPVIQSLPFEYDTILGKTLKQGEQLSQGEWQKIALARALYREANITILDEPTSWMDPEAEFEFFDKFHKIAKNRTAIMISHRLSSVRMVDKIVVFEDGHIVETGTHDELIKSNGRYAQIFKTQASNYQ